MLDALKSSMKWVMLDALKAKWYDMQYKHEKMKKYNEKHEWLWLIFKHRFENIKIEKKMVFAKYEYDEIELQSLKDDLIQMNY